jgi:E3 ubiquitin-protein ligase DOA10
MPLCRICLQEENETLNPLFSPCKCSGTMKYIHVNCLKEWLNSKKVSKETPFARTYFWKTLDCELCQTVFPNTIKSSTSKKSIDLRVI